MTSKARLALIRAVGSEQDNEGFSLLELVVVVAVMAVLSAVALPSFSCVLPKAKANAALVAMKQIQKECIIKKNFDMQEVFSDNNLQGYQISTNSCQGTGGNGIISAIPEDTNVAPTFILATQTNELSYSFKGKTGTNFQQCLSLICDITNGSKVKGGEAFKKELEVNPFVFKDTYIERGCSSYVIVKGETFDEAEANSKAIGGNLVTINNKSEYAWIKEKITNNSRMLKDSGYDKKNLSHTIYFVGLNDASSEGEYTWTSGEETEFGNNTDLIHRQNWTAQQHHASSHDYFVLQSNDQGFTEYTQDYRPELYSGTHGQLTWVDNNSSFYKGSGWDAPHFGLAEIPRCKK